MKQNQILENTKKMTDRSLELAQSVIEKSKKLRTPSPKIDKIGTTIGYVASTSLLIGGVIQIIVGKPTWALGSLSAGAIALLSNRYHYHHIKNKKIKENHSHSYSKNHCGFLIFNIHYCFEKILVKAF